MGGCDSSYKQVKEHDWITFAGNVSWGEGHWNGGPGRGAMDWAQGGQGHCNGAWLQFLSTGITMADPRWTFAQCHLSLSGQIVNKWLPFKNSQGTRFFMQAERHSFSKYQG